MIVNPFVNISSNKISEPKALALTMFGVTYARRRNTPAREFEHDHVTRRNMKKFPAVLVIPDIKYTDTEKRIDSAVEDGICEIR
mmetsp:Transcript_3292/g.6603  ORF Transcript_3292/g.6603 Transcript_3292/m.6603 type:complete len:84 (+) Transcript_3292:43-294(+)